MASLRPTLNDALERAKKYCAYQERSHSEVRTKLLGMHVYGDDLEDIMATLIDEGFLNEERYARSYASGKFRLNKWGRVKIRLHLKQKGVSEYCIDKGLEEIREEEYIRCIDDLIARKVNAPIDYAGKQKVYSHLMQKGYEIELIKERVEYYLKTQM